MYRFLVVLFCLGWMVSCGDGGNIETDRIEGEKIENSIQKGKLIPNWKPDPIIHLTKQFKGKNIDLELNGNLKGGEIIKYLWEEPVKDSWFERKNSIVQLSKSVLLYNEFPLEERKNHYYYTQPKYLEFLDTNTYEVLKKVNIWKNRPYKKIGDAKITFHNFDPEAMEVIPYSKQKIKITPDEYSLFTYVRSEGNHVIVNFELRSLVKNTVIGIRHTLHIYDLNGTLVNVLKDLPSIDGAVVTNNSKYMMYIFGGNGVATANKPFLTMDREGWGLMRLEDQKILYSEFTDDGFLAFNRLWLDGNFLRVAYSNPSTEVKFDLWIFFNENTNSLYKHKLTYSERNNMRTEWKKHNDWMYYIKKLKFKEIQMDYKL